MADFRGTAIKGYELRERIGVGGMGAVYKAYQSTIGREVAVKIILPGYANQPDFIRRFETEAQIIARLEHPYIVPLHDFWRDPEGAYLVMRYLRGGSLKEALGRGKYDLEAIALLLDQVAAALSVAHRSNIIHRDIKPANILLDEDGNAYLSDFGIAKNLTEPGAGLTGADGLIGSPDYLSPEQARCEPVSPQTDIYSLGVVLYEMLSGKHPFPDALTVERLFKHINEPLPIILSLEADIADAVNRVVQRATAKNPKHRYESAVAMAQAFREAARLNTSWVEHGLVELLTPREQEVLQLLIDGKSNREIADALTVELSTVKWYLNEIYHKLNVRSRVQAIVKAREMNLIVKGKVTTEGTTSLTALPEPANPYKGLRAFQAADHQDFFGRERMVHKLLKRLGEKDKMARFLAVVGPSGSGKSSLVKAGLIPALWRGELPGSDRWFIAEMMPGLRPLDELEVTLTRIAADQHLNLADQLARDEFGLLRAAQLILPDDGSELLLVIDQFEEVFTLVDEVQRVRFLGLIRAAVADMRSRVRVIITLRADFYDRPLQYIQFGEMVRERIETVLPLGAEELEQAIVRPAERVGITFEEGLVAAIIEDVHYQPGALPLMQYALTELFECREDRTLTHTGYAKIGRAVGALATRAEETYKEFGDAGREAARQVFLRMVTPGEGIEDIRRRVPRSELLAISRDPDIMDDVIDTYANYRLLALDHDLATRKPTVEVAHEALLREWERLREWLNESRADIRLQRQLAAAASDWSEAGKDASFLLRGARLEQFEGWSQATGLALTPQEHEYLQAGCGQRDEEAAAEAVRQAREIRLERRSRVVLHALVGVFAVAALLSGGLALWANQQRQEARRQAAILLSAQAETDVKDGLYDRAVLLSLEALQNYPYTAQAEHALGRAVSYNRALQQNTGHTKAVTSVDWSPDGTKLATSSVDNTVQVWDAATGKMLRVIELPKGITGNVYDWGLTVKWSPDGTKLLTISGDRFMLGSQDYDLILWDATTGKQIQQVEVTNQAKPQAGEGQVTSAEHYATSTAAAFAPKNGRLATVGGNNSAIVWDASLTTQAVVLTGHENGVNSVAWSPDETRLATASEDGTARLWDEQSGETLLVLSGHKGGVNQVAWSPDGKQVATAGKDGTVRFWDTATGKPVRTFETGSGIVWSLSWSSDGRYLATGSNDAVVRLWELESGKVIAELKGHQNFVAQVAWSPVDNRLASAGADSTARIWNVAPSTAVLSLPYPYVGELDWSSDSRYLALGTGDWWSGAAPDNLVVWDIARKQPIAENLGRRPGWFMYHPDFSPDNSLLLIQAYRGPFVTTPPEAHEAITFVVDVRSGQVVKTFSLNEGPGLFFRTVGWSPDGTKVATATASGTLIVWDYATGKILSRSTCGAMNNSLDWSPDGTKIAINCQTLDVYKTWVEIRDAATGKVLQTLSDPDPTFVTTGALWSPDGTRLLSVGGDDQVGSKENPVIIWDAKTGKQLVKIARHTGQIWLPSWSPNGKRVATGSTDDTTRIWNAETGDELLSLSTPNNWSATVGWSPDGRYLAVSTFSFDMPGRAEIWRVWQSTEELIAYAKECCVFRGLTPEERAQFGLPLR